MQRSPLVSFLPYAVILSGFFVLTFGFEFNGLFGQDAHEYLRFGKALKTEWTTGTPAGDFHWPKAYPMLGSILSYLGVSVLLSMQMISLFACMGSIFVANKIIRHLYQSDGAIFLLLGAASQVYFLRMGYLVMSDALCAFLIITAIFAYLKLKNKTTFGWTVLFLTAAIFAFYTRYASLPIILALTMHLLWTTAKKWNLWIRAIVGGVLILLGFVLLYTNNSALSQIADRIAEWSPTNLLHRTHSREGRLETNLVPNAMYIWSNFLHLGYLSIGVLLLPWIKQWNFKERGLWMAILVYLLFIGGLEIQNQRFMVLTHLPILVLLFPAFKALWAWLQSRKLGIVFCGAVLLFNGALFCFSFQKTYKVHRLEKQIVAALQPFDDATPILTFYVDQSFASYDLPNPTQNLWDPYPDFIPGALVVFNPEKFEESWGNGTVMTNWRLLQERHTLVVIKELPENWKIYRIK